MSCSTSSNWLPTLLHRPLLTPTQLLSIPPLLLLGPMSNGPNSSSIASLQVCPTLGALSPQRSATNHSQPTTPHMPPSQYIRKTLFLLFVLFCKKVEKVLPSTFFFTC